ncbi:hypothetical protein [Extibacter muris]|uniref:hypothetical protein n=1 Tax=Extibacter muris TaxID=1796622 RepID=UPI001D093F71|nr:hypothetical protein [Extibacter muris]MCB6201596.1 hypothetical protein [Extibacter muris]MCQ4662922.1 hypothetical protein [Extibacter muris]MCQ4694220.1 hypothetical protein [Extibacter muris]
MWSYEQAERKQKNQTADGNRKTGAGFLTVQESPLPWTYGNVIQRRLMSLEEFRQLTDRGGEDKRGKRNRDYYARLDRYLEMYHDASSTKEKKNMLELIMQELTIWQRNKPKSARNEVRGRLFMQAAEEMQNVLLEEGASYYDSFCLRKSLLEEWKAMGHAVLATEMPESGPETDSVVRRGNLLASETFQIEAGNASNRFREPMSVKQILEYLSVGVEAAAAAERRSVFLKCLDSLLPVSTLKGIHMLINGAAELSAGSHLLFVGKSAKEGEIAGYMDIFLSRLRMMSRFILDIAKARIPNTPQKAAYGERFLLESTGSDPHVAGRHAVFLYDRETYGPSSRPVGVYKPHDMASDRMSAGNQSARQGPASILSFLNQLLTEENFAAFQSAYPEDEFLAKIRFDQVGFATLSIDDETHIAAYAVKQPDMTSLQAASYFFNLGMLQLAAKVYSMQDLHQDNIMPVSLKSGCAPLIVDGEVSFTEIGVQSGIQEAGRAKKGLTAYFTIDGSPMQPDFNYIRAGYRYLQSVMSDSENNERLQKAVKPQMSYLTRVRILPYSTSHLKGFVAAYQSRIMGGSSKADLIPFLMKMAENGTIMDRSGRESGNVSPLAAILSERYFFKGSRVLVHHNRYVEKLASACEHATVPAFELYIPDDPEDKHCYVLLDAASTDTMPVHDIIATIVPPQPHMSAREMLISVRRNMIQNVGTYKFDTEEDVYGAVLPDKNAVRSLMRTTSYSGRPSAAERVSARKKRFGSTSSFDGGMSLEVGRRPLRFVSPVSHAEEKNTPHPNRQIRTDVPEGLMCNHTEGDGNCFFHAVYEALSGEKSTAEAQQQIRNQIAAGMRTNVRLAVSHFGPRENGDCERYIQSLTTPGRWVDDIGPALAADFLCIVIYIYDVYGHVYKIEAPHPYAAGPVRKVIHLQYTGNHYNSYTTASL